MSTPAEPTLPFVRPKMAVPPRSAISRFIERTSQWAERHDEARGVRIGSEDDTRHPPGPIASAWAMFKLLVIGVSSPLSLPLVGLRASINHRRALQLTHDFPHQVEDLAAHRRPIPPANRVERVPAAIRAVITSDLHRCIAGHNDWAARQHTKRLYSAMLDVYADRGDHLIENGDVEDFWMTGGSTYGAWYDIVRLVAWAIPAVWADELHFAMYRHHLEHIVENNAAIYERIVDRFASQGRYHRTVGNHDDVFLDPALARDLARHIGGVAAVDYVTLDGADGTTEAVIAHGHHTDGWCAPQRSRLGRLSSWTANTFVDVPGLNTPEGMPDASATTTVLEGRAPNRLITVNPVFGATASYDSMDEDELFRSMGDAATHGPWLLFGHTHVPEFQPVTRSGDRWPRYANSGCGVWDDMVTALEWDGTGADPVVRLVAWAYADDDCDPAAIVTTDETGRRIARFVLDASGEGDRLDATVDPFEPAVTAAS